jgi:hypothetical protein
MFESKWKSAYRDHMTECSSELYDEIAIRVAEAIELGYSNGDDRVTVISEIADEYGVSAAHVSQIFYNIEWSE